MKEVNNMIVKERLNKEELAKIPYEGKIYVGSIDNLEEYNTANYFIIDKFYQGERLDGYAVLYLGYQGIASNDISLEELVYWGPSNQLERYLREVVTYPTYPFFVEHFYYDKEKYGNLYVMLNESGFTEMARTR